MPRMTTLCATTKDDLAEIAALVRGRACDLRAVALDHQGGKLHIPVVAGQAPGTELIVRRIIEFSIEDPEATRWFDLDRLSYDRRSQRLSIHSSGPLEFRLTVDRLDVALRLRADRRGLSAGMAGRRS